MEFTHFDDQGNALMVAVGDKAETKREAVARGSIFMSPECLEKVARGTMAKGDVLGVARVAGIMGAKRTADLIPMCHILPITNCRIRFQMEPEECAVYCYCTVKVTGKTGVEMEALTGVSVALLTVYDMCKAVDKSMEIGDIYLEHKSGGKSGEFHNPRCARNRG